jgi:hypothetical protein
MVEIYRDSGDENEILNPPARLIRPAAATPPLPKAGVEAAEGFLRPFVNEEQNSRLPWTLPAGPWTVRWRHQAIEGHSPALVAQAADRCLLIYEMWPRQLLDLEGRLISDKFAAVGGWLPLMDPEKLLIWMGGDGVQAYRMTDGSAVCHIIAATMVRHTFLARRRRQFLVAGTQYQLHPHGGVVADRAEIEVVDLGDPIEVDRGYLKSPSPAKSLGAPSHLMALAVHRDQIVFAVPGRILLGGWNLELNGALQGSFRPVSLSLDEAGRIYLVVQTEGREELWGITLQGERFLSVGLPNELPDLLETHYDITAAVPPIIGYDHRIYVRMRNRDGTTGRLLAISLDGKVLWDYPISYFEQGGLVITADDRLLVAESDKLLAFKDSATPEVLHQFPGERLLTAPVLTQKGELLVATDKFLYCLTAKASN